MLGLPLWGLVFENTNGWKILSLVIGVAWLQRHGVDNLNAIGMVFWTLWINWRYLSHAACNSGRLVTRFPPLSAHPHSSVYGGMLPGSWTYVSTLNHFRQCTWAAPFKSRQEEVGFGWKKIPATQNMACLLPSYCSSRQFCTLALGR